MINVLNLETGDKIRLTDDVIAEVVLNPRDGVWVQVRYVSAPSAPDKVGKEELIFAETIIDLA